MAAALGGSIAGYHCKRPQVWMEAIVLGRSGKLAATANPSRHLGLGVWSELRVMYDNL